MSWYDKEKVKKYQKLPDNEKKKIMEQIVKESHEFRKQLKKACEIDPEVLRVRFTI